VGASTATCSSSGGAILQPKTVQPLFSDQHSWWWGVSHAGQALMASIVSMSLRQYGQLPIDRGASAAAWTGSGGGGGGVGCTGSGAGAGTPGSTLGTGTVTSPPHWVQDPVAPAREASTRYCLPQLGQKKVIGAMSSSPSFQ
jgi:hypothetical protein